MHLFSYPVDILIWACLFNTALAASILLNLFWETYYLSREIQPSQIYHNSIFVVALVIVYFHYVFSFFFFFTSDFCWIDPFHEWKSFSRVQLWQPHGLYNPWNSPGQNTGEGSLSLPGGSSQLRDRTQVSCIAGGFFTIWTTREAQEYWSG